MELLFPLAIHNLQGWHHNNWKKKSKGICYICDRKYTKGHKYAEKKLFYINCEEGEGKEQETSKEDDIHQEPTPNK